MWLLLKQRHAETIKCEISRNPRNKLSPPHPQNTQKLKTLFARQTKQNEAIKSI